MVFLYHVQNLHFMQKKLIRILARALHEYVNFVHGTEKPYRSLSIKIYIFMQCAPKSFTRISRLDSMSKCVDIVTFGHAVKSTQISHLRPVCTLQL